MDLKDYKTSLFHNNAENS